MKRIINLTLYMALLLGLATSVHAQALLADIWPGAESSAPKEFASLSNTLSRQGAHVFFAADDGITGIELWKSNGTEAGTVLIKDINLTGDSEPSWITPVGALMFFRADDGIHGDEVWVSDGTPEGTRLTQDIWEGEEGSHPEHIAELDGVAYFMAGNEKSGTELWRSDGVSTEMVMDINPGPGDSSPHWPVKAGDFLYFRADDGLHGEELWRTNGTITELVFDIQPGPEGSHPERLVAIGEVVYFPADDGTHGAELWASDGVDTYMVTDIYAGSDGGDPKHLTVVGDRLFFAAENGMHGSELWTSDGHAAGTRFVRDIRPGDAPSLPNNLTDVGGVLLFTANDGSRQHGTALWRSDGTEEGTFLVKDIRETGEPAFQQFMAVADLLFFTSNDGEHGIELWRSDGTKGGTFLQKDISADSPSSAPLFLTDVGGTLFFSATDGLNGRELWTYAPRIPPDVPVTRDDVVTTELGTLVTVDVLANDTGDQLLVVQVGSPLHGVATIEADGTVAYQPTADYLGEDTFVYTVEDRQGDTGQATVTVSVTPENVGPTISEIADQEMRESDVLEEVAFTIDDPDSSPNQLLVTATSSNQLIVLNRNIGVEGGHGHRALVIRSEELPEGTLTTRPVTRITVTVSDGSNEASTSFLLRVYPWKEPTISAVPSQYVYDGEPVGPIAFTVVDGDTDPVDLMVEAASDNLPLLSEAGIELGGKGLNRTVTLTPTPGQTGDALVTLTVRDTDGYVGSTTFTLHVYAEGTPVAVPDHYVGVLDQELIVPVETGVLANDLSAEGVALTALLETAPEQGILTLQSDGSFVYTPAPDEQLRGPGDDDDGGGHDAPIEFTYRVTDGEIISAPAQVMLTFEHGEGVQISFIPDQEIFANEVLGPIAFTVRPGHATVTAGSSDQTLVPDDNIVIEGSGPHGAGRNRTLTLTPAPDAHGTVVITVTAVNDHGGDGGDFGRALESGEEPIPVSQEFIVTIHPAPSDPEALARGDRTEAAKAGGDVLPTAFALDANYPNPFRSTTRIRYALPQAADVTLYVYEITGRRIMTVAEGLREAGWYHVDLRADHLASGVYFYRINAGDFSATRRLTVVR